MAGRIDAFIAPLEPPTFYDAGCPFVRLFEDYETAESDYFSRTGVYPAHHIICVKRDFYEQHPGLTRRLYDIFKAAKDLAVADLDIIQVPKVTLPWPQAIAAEVRGVMGEDFWPYGIAANKKVLETQLRWSAEDGLQARPIRIEDVFAADCLDT